MIGYYVHHQGLGHLTRALQITAQLRLRGEQVLGMSQLNRPAGWPGEWVRLPSDEAERPWDESAGGVLHWAPLRHPGLSGRMLAISQRLAELSVMVVDVSVEVALLARLFGVPVVVVAMRGDRADRPHLAGYDAATALLAPWEDGFPEGWWPDRWTAKTHFVGAMSRFDHRPFPVAGGQGSHRIIGVWGGGGTDLPDDAQAVAQSAMPDWEWVWRSPAAPSADLWEDLHACDVVVCHAGNNTVAEVAAARRPAIVVAQQRPFLEQHHTVAAIRRAGLAVALDDWPVARSWPRLIDMALRLGGEGWGAWNRRDGAARAAEVLVRLAAMDAT